MVELLHDYRTIKNDLTGSFSKYIREHLDRSHEYASIHGNLANGKRFVFSAHDLKLAYASKKGAKIFIEKDSDKTEIFDISQISFGRFKKGSKDLNVKFYEINNDERILISCTDSVSSKKIEIDCYVNNVKETFDSGLYKFESEYLRGGKGVHNHGLALEASGTISIGNDTIKFYNAEAFRENALVQAPVFMLWDWAHLSGEFGNGEKVKAIFSVNEGIVNNIGGLVWINGERIDFDEVNFWRDKKSGIITIFSLNHKINITFTPRYVEAPLPIKIPILASGVYHHQYGDFTGSILGYDNLSAFGATERNELSLI